MATAGMATAGTSATVASRAASVTPSDRARTGGSGARSGDALALTHVTVIDATGAAPAHDLTLIIEDKSEPPKTAGTAAAHAGCGCGTHPTP